MAAFNFPNSPSTNDLHTENGVTYKWNGTVWKRQNASYTDATNLNVTGIATFANNVSIGGILTYEDVKNVDSVGVITARSNVYIKNTYPRLYLQDTDSNSDFSIINSNGAFMVYDDTNSANRFTINSSGIGAFNSDLEVAGSHYITDSIIHTGDTNTKIRFPAADTITAETGGSERLRIDSSGRLIVGHTAAIGDLHGPQGTTNRNPFIQIHGANTASAGAALISWKNSAGAYYAPTLFLAHSGSDTKGTNAVIPANGEFGSIVFSGDDGTDFVKGAMIKARLDGTPGDNDMPGRLSFYTTPDGAQEPEERLRITSDGQIGVNNTSPDAWHTQYRSIQIYDAGVLYGSQDDSFVGLGANHFLNTSGDFKYSNTDFASRFYQVNGGFYFESVASGTAGNTFSFTEKLRIESGGDVLIGTTTSAGKLTVDSGTSNTCATFQSSDAGAGINVKDNHARSSIEQNGTTLKISADTGAEYANSDIRLQVDGATKVLIDSSGKVGINKTSPAELLDVYGTIQCSGAGLKIDTHPIVSYASFTDISGGSYAARLGSTGTSTIRSTQIYGGGGHIATFDGVNNRLGINVTSPDNRIEIRTTAHGQGLTIKSTGSTSNTIYLDANRSGANNGIGQLAGRWNGTTVAQMSFNCGDDTTDKNDGYIWFGTESAASNGNVNATERLRITSDGVLKQRTEDGSYYPIASSKDGSTSARAATSAWEIKRTLGPAAKTGYYYLKNPHDSNVDQWWCDMKTDGGGWILVAHHSSGTLGSDPGHWYNRDNRGGFRQDHTGTKKGGGYWQTWGDLLGEIMIEVRMHGYYSWNHGLDDDNAQYSPPCSKVGIHWGKGNNLPAPGTGNGTQSNFPSSRAFRDWCWEIENAPGYNPGNYSPGFQQTIVNGQNHFTEHFLFTWSMRGTGGSGDDGSNGPYWQIGSHHDGLHQHYEESASGDAYGDGRYQIHSGHDTSWTTDGHNIDGMSALGKGMASNGIINFWMR